MRWNTRISALALLTLCGSGQSISAAASPAPQGQQGAQPDSQATETWRAADGTLRSRPVSPRRPPAQPQASSSADPDPQPRWSDPAPAAASAPGTSYAAPGNGLPSRRPRTAPPVPAATQQVPPTGSADADPSAGANGPRGSSQPTLGEAPRYDEIGYAGIRPVSGGGDMDQAAVAVHRSLPANSYVEVTSLETGKTILVLVTGRMEPGSDHPIDLSAGAARLLGAKGDLLPVRLRTVNPTAGDRAALQAGRPASDRPDAPPVLLTALRKRLPPAGASAAPSPVAASPSPAAAPPRPAPVARRPAVAAPRPAIAARGRFVVQVAALSNAARAQALAQSLGGFVKPGGGLYRVQLGPFATPAQAQAARQRAAGAGYGDARVLPN